MRKSPNTWNDKLVHAELIKICAGTGVFPSCSEMESLGRGDLANQVMKRGGFIKWAKKLGYTRKDSDSDFGWDGESSASKKLTKIGFSVLRPDGVKCPYDLLLDGCLRVDVKTANFASYGVSKGWFYRIGKHSQADLIMLYQADTGEAYYIPWFSCPTSNITISQSGGVYKNFKENTCLVLGMISTRLKEIKQLSIKLDR